MMRIFLTLFIIILSVTVASSQTASQFEMNDGFSGVVIEFTEGDFIINRGVTRQGDDWQRAPNPNIDSSNASNQTDGQLRSMFGRFYFDRSVIGDVPTAIHLIGVRGNFSVSVNGAELFRNYADIHDQFNTWYRPFLIPVSKDALQSGMNEITIHSLAGKSVGIGRVRVGAQSALQGVQDRLFFWHITAPIAVGFILLMFGSLIFCFWLGRRHEIELFWLSLTAFLWYSRNHEFHAETIPFNFELYAKALNCATYFATASLLAFYFYFIGFPFRHAISKGLFAIGIVASILYVGLSLNSMIILLPTGLAVLIAGVVAILELTKQRTPEQHVVSLVMTLLPFATVYDIAIFIRYGGDGNATYIAVFCVPIVAIAFALSFGMRTLNALTELGKTNDVLEERIAQVRAELSVSEAQRQKLLVSQAISSERARLMQEMHDGIGSNLTTALAVAHQQDREGNTVNVLKRALGDLKLTVDSLEPVDGDLVALIGNLRHRMARDLADANMICKWEVELCAPLDWLDATNALHVLRIHNEAISNVLAHSNATEIRIGCAEETRDGRTGILTHVSDNGEGFDRAQSETGKGLANMKARARSLHGTLNYSTKKGEGTTVELWLPYER